MFFLSNRTCRTGLSRFGKLTFPKSADSQFLKTADCDYSEICRNKVTAYIPPAFVRHLQIFSMKS